MRLGFERRRRSGIVRTTALQPRRRRAISRHDCPTSGQCGTAVPIPADCWDGFLGAYWQRPSAYLDPLVRNGISTFSKIDARDIDLGLDGLQADVQSGAWAERHAAILDRSALDVGYRIVTGAVDRRQLEEI
jgi:hypothetical protein